MKKSSMKKWQYFVDRVVDGGGGEVYTGNLKYPVQITTVAVGPADQRYIDAGLFLAKDRRYLTRLFGCAPRMLEALEDATNRLDKLTEDSPTSRGWLDDLNALIEEVKTDVMPSTSPEKEEDES